MIQLNNYNCINANLSVPYRGAWILDAYVAWSDAAAFQKYSPAILNITNGLSYSGTVIESSDEYERVHVRITAGKSYSLPNQNLPKFFTSTTRTNLIKQLVTESGNLYDSRSRIVDQSYAQYALPVHSYQYHLSKLVGEDVFRFTADGQVLVQTASTIRTNKSNINIENLDIINKVLRVSPDFDLMTIEPDDLIDDGKKLVKRIDYTFSGETRANIWYDDVI